MLRRLRWLLALAVALGSLGSAPPATDLPVVCYHDIGPKPQTEMTTTPELFTQQMDYLAREGYRPVSLEEATGFMAGSRKLAGKPILITFDDGYSGVYQYALPALKKHGFKATLFLIVGKVGVMKPTAHLTWEQLAEMRDSGCFEFGSHSYDMHIEIPEALARRKISLFGLKKDLIRSREVLQQKLGVPVRSLAWPYGHYDDRSLATAKEAGFRLCFTTDYGPNHYGDGCFLIRRIRLSSQWDTVDRMRQKLAGS